jgi:hypothetical protein
MAEAIAQAGSIEGVRETRRVLYWMALVATILGALYLVGLVGRIIVNGSVHAVSGGGVQLVSAVVAIAWDVVLLVLFAALRRAHAGQHPLLGDLALIFMALTCVTSSINWFVQLAVLPRLGSDAAALAVLDVHNELSITYAVEHLGWGLFFGLSVLFAAALLRGSIRWLLVASGVLSLLHFLGVIVASPFLGDLGYIAWGVLLPAATGLLASSSRKA